MRTAAGNVLKNWVTYLDFRWKPYVTGSLETRNSEHFDVILVTKPRTEIRLFLKRRNTLPTSFSKAPLNRHPFPPSWRQCSYSTEGRWRSHCGLNRKRKGNHPHKLMLQLTLGMVIMCDPKEKIWSLVCKTALSTPYQQSCRPKCISDYSLHTIFVFRPCNLDHFAINLIPLTVPRYTKTCPSVVKEI
jgi:hypothetical protein